MSETVADRARARLRDEMQKKNLTQTDVAGILGWPTSRVSKVLHGHIKLSVDDLADLCFALSLHLSEAIRDRGLEFFAEMTPRELRLVEHLRELPKDDADFVVRLVVKQLPEARRAAPRIKRS